MKVMVVDDDAVIGHALTLALSAEESIDDIRVVRSGQAALDCDDFQPDLIILDYWMPGMNGDEAAVKIREMYPDARIVAFSAALQDKPGWADDFYPKGDLPDLQVLIHLND